MPTTQFDKESIKRSILGKLQRYNGRTLADATEQQIYYAVASTVRDQIMQKWMAYREKDKSYAGKRLYYLSVEFLTGRSLHCNILNLCSTEEYRQAMEELGLNWREICREEPEPGLGNGGLGRLAACFLDSLATLALPAMGCTIRYEYGLFRQKHSSTGNRSRCPITGWNNGNVWEFPAMDDTVRGPLRRLCGGIYRSKRPLKYSPCRTTTPWRPCPMTCPWSGYDCETVNMLRVWSRPFQQGSWIMASFNSGQYSQAPWKSSELAERYLQGALSRG